jgi:hypothetical protein
MQMRGGGCIQTAAPSGPWAGFAAFRQVHPDTVAHCLEKCCPIHQAQSMRSLVGPLGMVLVGRLHTQADPEVIRPGAADGPHRERAQAEQVSPV